MRICFILGNMTAKNDDARLLLHQEKKSLEIILNVISFLSPIGYSSADLFYPG